MNMNDLFPSNYLKKEDFETPRRLRIVRVAREEIGQGSKREQKAVIYFEGAKPMVLNKTNGQILAEIFGYDTSLWIGQMVEVYNDTSVTYRNPQTGKEERGGIRVRMPRGGHTSPQEPSGLVFWDWGPALAKAAEYGITADEVKAMLKSQGFTSYRASRDTATIRAMIEQRKQAAQEEEVSFDDGPEDEVSFDDDPPPETSFTEPLVDEAPSNPNIPPPVNHYEQPSDTNGNGPDVETVPPSGSKRRRK